MKILVLSTLYPNAVQRRHGIFIEHRVAHLQAAAGDEVRVVAPVPWFPFENPRFGAYAEHARAPRSAERRGLTIVHPRYPTIPKVGMTAAPWLMAAALALTDVDGEPARADELMLPDAALRPLLADDAPPAVLAPEWQERVSREVLVAVGVLDGFVAVETDAAVAREGSEFAVVERRVAVGGQQLTLQGLGGVYDDVFLPLHGEHQANNAAVALAAVEAFFGAGADQQLDIDTVREGFAKSASPGRLERVRSAPTVLLDAAHNPHGAQALARTIETEFGFRTLIGVVSIRDFIALRLEELAG